MVNNDNVKNNASNRQQQNCGQLKKKIDFGTPVYIELPDKKISVYKMCFIFR